MTFTGYIYKITGTCGRVYIGSTTNIVNRKSQHKFGDNSNSKLLQKPLRFEIIDTREYKLVKTLRLVEQFYLDNNNTINQVRAYANMRNYYYKYRYNNREKIKESQRIYTDKNREILNKKNRERYHKNIEKERERGRIYAENNREKKRERSRTYRENNREKINEKCKIYRDNNKEKIKQQRNVKIVCECGCLITKVRIARHKRSPKHINLLNQKSIN